MSEGAQADRLESPSGLRIELAANGCVRRIDHGEVLLNTVLGNELEGGLINLYLRRHDGGEICSTPLIGPRGALRRLRRSEDRREWVGEWLGLRCQVALVLAQTAATWFWQVSVDNGGSSAASIDLIYAQDTALSSYGAVRNNEYYVSQYVDHAPLTHPRQGDVLAVRQNLAVGGRHPWAMIGALDKAISYETDGLQFYGLTQRAGQLPQALAAPRLAGIRRQHEHSMAGLQQQVVSLAPGASWRGGFFCWFEPDHPQASSAADLSYVDRALALPEAGCSSNFVTASDDSEIPAATLFTIAPLLAAQALRQTEITARFGSDLRQVERSEAGEVLSFFTGTTPPGHVVLRDKELTVLRPHGHIIRSGNQLVPDERSLTSNTWMSGIFHSLVTEGHVNINRLLSNPHGYLSAMRVAGQRLFVEIDGVFHLLDVPSAYVMTPNTATWIYRWDQGELEVRSWAGVERHELGLAIAITGGAPRRLLLAQHVAIDGDDGAAGGTVTYERHGSRIEIRPRPDSELGRRFPHGWFEIDLGDRAAIEQVGGDELLFRDGRSRQQPVVTVVTHPLARLDVRITGHLVSSARAPRSRSLPGKSEGRFWGELLRQTTWRSSEDAAGEPGVARLGEILPWFTHNAMIHYLAPRGLEQYSGGGWGTRDVCQGPLELLLAIGEWQPIRQLLQSVFEQQNPDGDWPQWFMFFDRERNIRPGDSHGDIIFWPLLALAEYLLASDDAALLDEVIPFFDRRGKDRGEPATIWRHVERALAAIEQRLIPHTALAAYGRGDWNDSLQPVDPAMSESLCSAWTVALHYQTSNRLAQALRHSGRDRAAAQLETAAAAIRRDYQRYLLPDGTVAAYAHFPGDGEPEYLLHPRDSSTGIHYSLLAMSYGILSELFTPEQAYRHARAIAEHLLAPDGARLFDRPFPYRGGPQKTFQRAESSSFFGREIGIMYMHANLRYAEAMAHYGDAGAFWRALQLANPIGIEELVASARRRQANCYYSSSDADFADRYQAEAEYERVKRGAVALEGGWRIYSSGAGIAVRLIVQCFLGLRRGHSQLTIDPVLPTELDGLEASTRLEDCEVRLVYRSGSRGCGPVVIELNGAALPFTREANPYRVGGACVAVEELRRRLKRRNNTLRIELL